MPDIQATDDLRRRVAGPAVARFAAGHDHQRRDAAGCPSRAGIPLPHHAQARRRVTSRAPVVKLGGKTTSAGRRCGCSVLPPSAQDLAVLELSADRPAIYPTQQFTVTLSVFVKGLPAAVADHDPLSVQKQPPMLQDSLAHRSGTARRAVAEGGLANNGSRASTTARAQGFGINELVQNTAFSMFGEHNALAFRPKPQVVTRRDAQGHEVKYCRYDFATDVHRQTVRPRHARRGHAARPFWRRAIRFRPAQRQGNLRRIEAAADHRQRGAPGRSAR